MSSILIGPYTLCTSSSIGFPHPIVAVTLTTQAILEVRTRQDPPIVLELVFTGLCLPDMKGNCGLVDQNVNISQKASMLTVQRRKITEKLYSILYFFILPSIFKSLG